MSNPTSSLSEKDIPFLLEQLEFQSNSLAEAEQTITKFQNAGSGKTQAMTADEKDEADLEIETLQDRYDVMLSDYTTCVTIVSRCSYLFILAQGHKCCILY